MPPFLGRALEVTGAAARGFLSRPAWIAGRRSQISSAASPPEAQSCEAFLSQLEAARPEIDLGLDKSRELLARVGDPHKHLRVVHVAGTNGKGSVCAMVAAVLRAAGKRVGVYNSPHLFHWSEAVLVDGASDVLSWRASVRSVQRVLVNGGQATGAYTAFEVTCAAMWLQLATAKVDYAVIEAGVGGSRDATNVCDSVCAAAITSVGLDHQDLLGGTIPEIAHDKAGIFKKGCPAVVSSRLPQEALNVAQTMAAQVGCDLITAPPAVRLPGGEEAVIGCSRTRLQWPGHERRERIGKSGVEGALNFELGLLGDVQLANAGVALGVLRELQRRDQTISDEHIRQGLATARWPGRLEWARWQETEILLDGAHNTEAAVALAAFLDPLRATSQTSGVHWIVGMSGSKDVEGIISALVRPGDVVECVLIRSLPRRHQPAPTSRIRLAVEAAGGRSSEAPDLEHALMRACAPAGAGARLPVLCGSLHLVADFRQLLAPVGTTGV